MDKYTTWYGCMPRPRRHCVRWGPSSPHGEGHSSPHFSAHVYCGQTVARLSKCWALVNSGLLLAMLGHTRSAELLLVSSRDNELWYVSPITFELDPDSVKRKQYSKYMGQVSFIQKLLLTERDEIWQRWGAWPIDTYSTNLENFGRWSRDTLRRHTSVQLSDALNYCLFSFSFRLWSPRCISVVTWKLRWKVLGEIWNFAFLTKNYEKIFAQVGHKLSIRYSVELKGSWPNINYFDYRVPQKFCISSNTTIFGHFANFTGFKLGLVLEKNEKSRDYLHVCL